MAKPRTLPPDEHWLVMTTGYQGIERPYDLLADLIREYGVSEQKANVDSEKESEYGEITATGWRGTKKAGYRWTEWRDARSNAHIGCRAETYGLHDVTMVWRFSLSKSGYEYSYVHGIIHVRFDSDEEQRRFALWWHAKVGHRPTLEPAPAPPVPAE